MDVKNEISFLFIKINVALTFQVLYFLYFCISLKVAGSAKTCCDE